MSGSTVRLFQMTRLVSSVRVPRSPMESKAAEVSSHALYNAFRSLTKIFVEQLNRSSQQRTYDTLDVTASRREKFIRRSWPTHGEAETRHGRALMVRPAAGVFAGNESPPASKMGDEGLVGRRQGFAGRQLRVTSIRLKLITQHRRR